MDQTRVGTVIDEQSAIYLETVVREAVSAGVEFQLAASERRIDAPTVIANVPRDCRMVVCESFGRSRQSSPSKTSTTQSPRPTRPRTAWFGVVTNSLDKAIQMRSGFAGTVNVNEVPGYVSESRHSADQGLRAWHQRGMIEAMKHFSFVKTFPFQ